MTELQNLLKQELLNCRDYHFSIDRSRIKFGGVGPRTHGQPRKIWPRDVVDPEDEIRKILSDELKSLINNEAQCLRIRNLIQQVFSGLKRCNINSLFNKYCRNQSIYFNEIPFRIHHALDSDIKNIRIMTMIHHTIRAINVNRKPRQNDLVLTLFGCRRNYELYKKHIAIIVGASSALREIKLGHIVSYEDTTMDLTKFSWLAGVNPKAVPRVLLQVIYAITRFIMELLRRYFYITISNPHRDMLFYYRYDTWQKMYSRGVQELIDQGILLPDESNAIVGTATFSAWTRVSKLKFYLKQDGLRPICTTCKPEGNIGEKINFSARLIKAVLKFVLTRSPNYKKFNLNNLMLGLKQIRRKIVNENQPIYFVKVDLKNCFQSIEQNKLRDIIVEILNRNTENCVISIRKLICQPKERRTIEGKLKQGRGFEILTMNPEAIRNSAKFHLVQEFSKPISLTIQAFDQLYLSPNLINPILIQSRPSKRPYKLLKGLRQGFSFSPLLCSIYILAAFNKYLSEHLQSDNCYVFRHVDDILFLSTDLEMARKFMHRMLEGFKDFNLKVNLEKSVCNFEWSKKYMNICRVQNDDVVFFKQHISMKTLQCRYCYSNGGLSLEYTFKASPYSSQAAVRDELLRSKVDLIHLDCELNQFDQLVENIFEKCLLLAHKAATMIIVSIQLSKLERQDSKFITNLMLTTAKRMNKTIKEGVKRQLINNELTYPQIRLLASSAFLCTWNRNKMRHRNIERLALEQIRERYKMRYLVLDVDKGFWWDEKIFHLDRTFNASSFAKQVSLPNKHY